MWQSRSMKRPRRWLGLSSALFPSEFRAREGLSWERWLPVSCHSRPRRRPWWPSRSTASAYLCQWPRRSPEIKKIIFKLLIEKTFKKTNKLKKETHLRQLKKVYKNVLTVYESVTSRSSLTFVNKSPESGSILKSSVPFKLYSIRPLSARSESWALIRRILDPIGKFSFTLARIAEVGKVGALSLMSSTLMVTSTVPVSCGDPPSTAVTINWMVSRVSRSSGPVNVKNPVFESRWNFLGKKIWIGKQIFTLKNLYTT